MAQIDSSSENTKIYDEAQVQRYLKASVELAIGDGEYQVGMVNELEKNIVSYCTKKLNSHIQKPHKYIVQNKGAGFHVFSSTHWDQKTDV
ncbi:hypothetical protein H4219_002590 [Mycoemilia scoparia]|uniref:Dynein light chain n=1 Tax=Mycoemilia scoparia TaxID=417184 RepID=A0A9W7ZX08_9FUNG|nr:hypothetical protein H4219_002590 [Mycoemilia scoparia]